MIIIVGAAFAQK